MKAVNLLPRDAQRSFGAFRGASSATIALLGVLATALVMVLAYVLLTNSVSAKREELAGVNQQIAAAERQAGNLKPYADLEQLRTSLLERVRTLAGSRYDWPTTLERLARAFPADATLTSLDGTAAAEGGTGGATASGPTASLAGCTPSHDAVARLIDRLRAVEGVQGVTLQSSTVADSSGDSGSTTGASAAGGCSGPEQFKLEVQLKGPATAASTAPAAGAGTTSTPTPAPASGAPAGGTQ